jgi:O-antigen ligase
MARFALICLFLFPLLDWFFRKGYVPPVLASSWDELVLAILLAYTVRMYLFERHYFVPELKLAVGMMAAFAVGVLVLTTDRFSVGVEGWRAEFEYMVALFVGFYLLRGRLGWAVQVMAGVGLVVALVGVWQFVVGAPMPAGWVDASESVRTRAYSIVQSPNVLGAYMTLLLPIAMGIGLSVWRRARLRGWMWFGVAGVFGLTLLFTGSRGAWLAAFVAMGWVGWFVRRRVVLVGLIVVVLAGAMVPGVRDRVVQLGSAGYLAKSGHDGRLARWQGAVSVMRDHPLFGVGLGHYGGAVGARVYGTTYVDSYGFKLLAETGLVGLALYVWLAGGVLVAVHRRWRRRYAGGFSGDYFLVAGVYAGLLGVLLHNAVENIFEVPFMAVGWWLLAGAVLAKLAPTGPPAWVISANHGGPGN